MNKIIEKIGPILAINNKEIPHQHELLKKLIKNCPENSYISGNFVLRHEKTKNRDLFFARGSHNNG